MNKIPLHHIAFELTDICNLKCKYCYNIWKTPTAAPHTSFNAYNKALATLTEVFKQAEVKNVAFTGGEPFIAERMLEVALFCRMQQKTVTLITNGTRGTKLQYKQLVQMGVTLFELPLHSPHAAVHDEMTQLKGSWEKSLQSVRALQELGAYVIAVVVITKYNVDHLLETLEFIHSKGIRRIMLNRYNIGGEGVAEPKEVSATHTQLKNAYADANSIASILNLKLTSNVCTPQCLLNPKDYPRIGFGNCSENVLNMPTTIDINGNVRLCNHSPVIVGNVFEKHLQEIMTSHYAQSWSNTKVEACESCHLWKQCRGGCRAASEQCNLGLNHIDPIMNL